MLVGIAKKEFNPGRIELGQGIRSGLRKEAMVSGDGVVSDVFNSSNEATRRDIRVLRNGGIKHCGNLTFSKASLI